ncbi:TIGR03016 family PEP-CTERM system-associated outer membrane protein [Candidatus Methylomicrobium oryzae]|uniref:TIGR03016 family PEP-CTERM system-associated outer membrane protein n=1 Tax=Candidatus Methylomicrobium oryzae TaxID=2802053 RepID=UPI0030173C22
MIQRKSNTLQLPIIYLAFIYLLFHSYGAYGVNWSVRPSISVQEVYSDNIRLSQPGTETNALVTEISPGISVRGQSARTMLNLNYRMQNLYNANGDNGLTTNNQLQYNSRNTLISNRLFLDSNSSISQQNTNINRIANDNISGSENNTTVTTFGISPFWTPRFGNYASGIFRLNFNTVSTSGSSFSNNDSQSTLSAISDSKSLGEIIQIHSGSEFKRFQWNLSHNNTENFRDNDDNTKFQNTSATLRTYVNRYFSVFALGGYSNNNFQATTNTNNNGFYYTVGGKWTPSRHYSIEIGGGNNRYISVYISPIQRINWITTFRDNSVGLNSGKTWETSLNYWTKRSRWSLTHENDTTTVQDILLQQQVFTVVDLDGNPVINPVTNQPVQFSINIPTLTNEVVVRKRWNFSVSFSTAKTTLYANAYDENRVFQVSGNTEKVSGFNAGWNWQFGRKTTAYLHSGWQQVDTVATSLTASNIKSDRYDFAIGLNQFITRRLNGKLEYRHVNNQSDNDANDYQENRATASLFMTY